MVESSGKQWRCARQAELIRRKSAVEFLAQQISAEKSLAEARPWHRMCPGGSALGALMRSSDESGGDCLVEAVDGVC